MPPSWLVGLFVDRFLVDPSVSFLLIMCVLKDASFRNEEVRKCLSGTESDKRGFLRN